MIDLDGATSAVIANGENAMLKSMIGFGAENSYLKASWNAAINGSYSLLSPLIHADYPSRKEVMEYVWLYISKAFLAHHEANLHSQPQFSAGSGVTIVDQDESLGGLKFFPPEIAINKIGRPIQATTQASTAGGDLLPDTETGVFQVESIMANPLSPSFKLLSV